MGVSHINANPEQEEQGSKSHENRGHGSNQQLLEQFSGKLAGCNLRMQYIRIMIWWPTSFYTTTDLIDEEPGGEEESDAEEDKGEVREHCGVDGRHVAGHGADVGDGHDADCSEMIH